MRTESGGGATQLMYFNIMALVLFQTVTWETGLEEKAGLAWQPLKHLPEARGVNSLWARCERSFRILRGGVLVVHWLPCVCGRLLLLVEQQKRSPAMLKTGGLVIVYIEKRRWLASFKCG